MKDEITYLDYQALKMEELVEIAGRIEKLLEEIKEVIKCQK